MLCDVAIALGFENMLVTTIRSALPGLASPAWRPWTSLSPAGHSRTFEVRFATDFCRLVE